jgi:hypothetical protein
MSHHRTLIVAMRSVKNFEKNAAVNVHNAIAMTYIARPKPERVSDTSSKCTEHNRADDL